MSDTTTHERMKAAFAALDLDDEATYVVTVSEGTPAMQIGEEQLPGTTVRSLIRAQTWLASAIEQTPTGAISVRLAGQDQEGAERKRTCLYRKAVNREFIIVGQCQGTGYTLWDVAPAPTERFRRAAVLEELSVDAMDASGSVNTEHGATAREAVDRFVAQMREQSGLDSYGLTADSQTEKIDECDAVRAHAVSPRATETARTALLANTVACAARLIRSALPTATVITVDTEEKELHEVRDAEGRTLWYAPASGGRGIPDTLVDDIDDLFRGAIPYGNLAGAGWTEADTGLPYRDVQLPELPAGKRHARAYVLYEGMVCHVHADLTPSDTPSFTLVDCDDKPMPETRDRVRAAILNSGYAWPDGEVTVVLHGSARPGPAADLGIACAILAAAGHVNPRALKRTVLIGELGLDGRVREPRINIRYADVCGRYRRLIVAAPSTPAYYSAYPLIPGGSVHATTDLRQALAFLAQPLNH